MNRQRQTQRTVVLVATVLLLCPILVAQPNLTGTYDVGTLTPLQRSEAHGDRLYLTAEEAGALEQRASEGLARANAASDPGRSAPSKGGRVGGYNAFWIDRGSSVNRVDGKLRTSILDDPTDGRIPAMTEQGAARLQGMLDEWKILWRSPDPTSGKNDGTAWWLDLDGPGPYDNLEQRPLAERCIFGSRSTTGPPMLPNIYNNHKRIVQTEDHVMILTEMNHDVRTIQLDAQQTTTPPRWFGDSVGRWQGDTLIVETRNFGKIPTLSGADENLEVREEFERQPDGSLRYRFTINDPTVWSRPWSGEYSWAPSDGRVYEYACHEGNYTLGNVMRGARVLERQATSAR